MCVLIIGTVALLKGVVRLGTGGRRVGVTEGAKEGPRSLWEMKAQVSLELKLMQAPGESDCEINSWLL